MTSQKSKDFIRCHEMAVKKDSFIANDKTDPGTWFEDLREKKDKAHMQYHAIDDDEVW